MKRSTNNITSGTPSYNRNTFLQKHHITLRDSGKVNQYKCERNPDPVPSKYKKPSSLTQNQIFPLFAPRFTLAKPKKSDKPTTKAQKPAKTNTSTTPAAKQVPKPPVKPKQQCPGCGKQLAPRYIKTHIKVLSKTVSNNNTTKQSAVLNSVNVPFF